jgi:hypothetical protein
MATLLTPELVEERGDVDPVAAAVELLAERSGS